MRHSKTAETCYVCKSRKTIVFLSINKLYKINLCENCSVVFTYPQPKYTKTVNERVYDSQEELESRITNFPLEYQRAKEHILNFMKYKKSGKYLDVGCSYGIGLKVAKDLGFTVMGIEPTKKAAEFAKKQYKVNVIQKTLESANLKSNSFDVISLYDVLEHIPNLKKFLKEINRILKPGGLLVMQSPNIESYAFQLLKNKWNWLLVPNHLWHFSKSSINKLLQTSEFRMINFQTRDNAQDFASNLKSKIFSYNNPKNIFEKILQKLTYMICYSIIYLSSPAWSFFNKGGVLQVYAVKK